MTGRRGSGRGMALGQKYLAVGMRFAGGIILFMFGGFWLDRWLGTTPILTLGGTVVGAVLSFLSVYRQVVTDTDVDEDGPTGRW